MAERIGAIHHIFRRGVYRSELTLGGYEVQTNLPATYREIDLDAELLERLEQLTAQLSVQPSVQPSGQSSGQPQSVRGLGFGAMPPTPADLVRGLGFGVNPGQNVLNLPEQTSDAVLDALMKDIMGDIDDTK